MADDINKKDLLTAMNDLMREGVYGKDIVSYIRGNLEICLSSDPNDKTVQFIDPNSESVTTKFRELLHKDDLQALLGLLTAVKQHLQV